MATKATGSQSAPQSSLLCSQPTSSPAEDNLQPTFGIGLCMGSQSLPAALEGSQPLQYPRPAQKACVWRGEQLESFKPGHGIKEMAFWRSRTQHPLRAGPLPDEDSCGSAQLSLGTPSLELLHRPADLSRGFTVPLGMKCFPQHPA